jgi:hypothetical protein
VGPRQRPRTKSVQNASLIPILLNLKNGSPA